MASNNPQNPQGQQQPGLFASHAEYIKGAAEVGLNCCLVPFSALKTLHKSIKSVNSC